MDKKKILLIGAGVVFTIFILFLLFLGGNSGTKNVPNEETLNTNFSNVVCEVAGEENVEYDISTLTNNIQFDSSIKSKPYTKIKVTQKENFKSLGVAFMVKTSKESTLKFNLMKNDEVLKTCNISAEANKATNVDLVLETGVDISKTDEFSIVIEGSTDFVFDTILIFIDEV